jgi:D-aminopeptidase
MTEWACLETPILLTHSLAVGRVADAASAWMVESYPGIGDYEDVVLPVVGECDDSFLSDAVGVHVTADHVYKAIQTASAGPVAEGSVGAGTGMITCDFKAGIGTSSRRIRAEDEAYTVGVLVLSNWGKMRDLRIDGVPVGSLLEPDYTSYRKRERNQGSIVVVLATDSPLLPSQLNRVCKRAALGLGRAGSYAAHSSGEIIIGFSTAITRPRKVKRMATRFRALLDECLNPFYEATVEATEEAIANSLCMAEPMIGANEQEVPALPLDKVEQVMGRYRPGERLRR